MRSIATFLLPFVFAALGQATAYAQSAEDHFRTGVAAFQKKDLEQARMEFTESLKLDPTNPVALYNLGLVEQKSGKTGLALGLWRKASAENPEYSPAQQSIRWAKSKLERAEIPHEAVVWETFRGLALETFSLYKFVLFTAVFLLSGGWLLLRYFGARRRALLDEQPLPPFPTVAVILSVGFVVMSFLSVAKAIDQSNIRGTILPKKVEARSTPDASGTVLFDLYEGLEVIVQQSNDAWIQVTYPGGPTGWVPKSTVFTTRDDAAAARSEK